MARNEFDLMTPEKRIDCARRDGIASGEARRCKKAMRETLEILHAMPMKRGKV